MRNLAEALGMVDPKESSPQDSGQTILPENVSARDFARSILLTPEYRRSIFNRIILGELSPQIEALWYHYAYGKPVERVEWKDTTDPYEHLTAEQCEERAMELIEIARRIRHANDTTVDTSVH